MDDIELKNIQLQFPTTRSLLREDSTAHEEVIETSHGQVTVAVQGSRNKPAIVTYHDLGLNCEYYMYIFKNHWTSEVFETSSLFSLKQSVSLQ